MAASKTNGAPVVGNSGVVFTDVQLAVLTLVRLHGACAVGWKRQFSKCSPRMEPAVAPTNDATTEVCMAVTLMNEMLLMYGCGKLDSGCRW